jgi:hypothetical protein
MKFREEYKAAWNTVRDAIKWLTNRQLVETKPGMAAANDVLPMQLVDRGALALRGPRDIEDGAVKYPKTRSGWSVRLPGQDQRSVGRIGRPDSSAYRRTAGSGSFR